jgi:nicotinate-nucleotide pyrophosphorylase (carboxylating)
MAFERVALNFLQRLSGVATLTALYVDRVKDTGAEILDTRKTTPGWRRLEKYAVRCGGGRNHRFGLFDAILIKDNHLAALVAAGASEPIGAAIASARESSPAGTIVEIEVDTPEQFEQALRHGPDIILLDNLGAPLLARAVHLRDVVAPTVILEASGGVSLESIHAIARSGVDRISIGALTHSAPALDLAFDLALADAPAPEES